MSKFQAHLKSLIRENGPVDVGTFMGLAVGHYYKTRDPFGVRGDFTTAPEISQMFGEMIGVFIADAWLKMGSPAAINLVEAGPGRGTLMMDVLRATKIVPGFHQAIRLHLIEMSPVLKEKQREALMGEQVTWHETFVSVPQDAPLFFIANEFLDALPIQQYIWQDGAWHLRVVGLEGENLSFGAVMVPVSNLPKHHGPEGGIWEHAPARDAFVGDVAAVIKKCSGLALFIDYGHNQSGMGDTLQAVRAHKFVPLLDDVGEADLTSHVDFEAVARVARVVGNTVHGPIGQGDFLNNLGIGLRAGRLNQAEEFHRLTAPEQMGDLFKVVALCHDPAIKLAGFDT